MFRKTTLALMISKTINVSKFLFFILLLNSCTTKTVLKQRKAKYNIDLEVVKAVKIDEQVKVKFSSYIAYPTIPSNKRYYTVTFFLNEDKRMVTFPDVQGRLYTMPSERRPEASEKTLVGNKITVYKKVHKKIQGNTVSEQSPLYIFYGARSIEVWAFDGIERVKIGVHKIAIHGQPELPVYWYPVIPIAVLIDIAILPLQPFLLLLDWKS